MKKIVIPLLFIMFAFYNCGKETESEVHKLKYIDCIDTTFVSLTQSDSIKICTLSSIKGLEFTNVFILDVNDDVIPYPPGFNDENDEYHISTERRLLYTAMTRARINLYLLSSGNPSRYLSEIKEELVDVCSRDINIQLSDEDDDLPF